MLYNSDQTNEYMSEYSGMHVLEEHTNITVVIFVSEQTLCEQRVFMMTEWPEALMTSSAGQRRRWPCISSLFYS